jgi:capsular polysaccharide biosynthesis protein
VAISGTGQTPRDAELLTIRATNAFKVFLQEQQAMNRIPTENRVLLTVITKADPPALVKGRSKTLPVVVFVTVLLGVVGLVFKLENMRPRIRPVDDVKRIPAPEQRSA